MLLRRVRSALAGVAAIGGIALLVAPGPTSAVVPAGSPTLTLLNQSESVTPSSPGAPASFVFAVVIGGPVAAGAELGLTFYAKLGTRSAFEQTLTNAPTVEIQKVAPVPIASLKAVPGGGVQDQVTVVANTYEPDGSSTVDLGNCTVGNGSCSGVYPAVIQLVEPSGDVVAHLNTYLTYAEEKSAKPLVFSWVVPISAPVGIRSGGGLSDALPPLKAKRVRDLTQLADSLASSSAHVSLAASPAVVEKLENSGSADAGIALRAITALVTSGPNHRFIAEPYVPISLGALTAAGVSTEIAGQMKGVQAFVSPLMRGLPATDQPSSATWVESGPVSSSTVQGLGSVGATSLVVPDSDLPPATELAHATWSQPFTLSTARGQSVTAAVSDTQLSGYFTAEPRDPVLAATQLLADLAVIHYELPGALDQTRGVIAVPPSSWDPQPAFVETLLAGLASDPVVATATLPEFFSGLVPIGGNQAETTRRLGANETGQSIDASEAAAIVTACTQIDGFLRAVQGHPIDETQLNDLLLTSESSELKPAAQRAGIATFERDLVRELADVQVVGNTVTLTARTASIPITIVSSATYPLRAKLTLKSDKLQFPQGAARTVFIDHPTNSIRIEVRARTSGDLPLSYKLTSPGGALVIAQGRLTVRSTATSIVGIALTLVAAVVLLGWWARTWYRGRRQRRARSARGTAT